MEGLKLEVLVRDPYLVREQVKKRNKAFTFWKDAWETVHEELDLDNQVGGDIFHRYDLIMVIFDDKDEVRALSFHSFMDLNDLACLDLKYLKMFDDDYIKSLRLMGGHRVMSTEYLTVDPALRKKKLARVMIQLHTWLFDESFADFAVAAGRNDVGVTKILLDAGYNFVVRKSKLRGFDCSQMFLDRKDMVASNKNEVLSLAKSLWHQRFDERYVAGAGSEAA